MYLQKPTEIVVLNSNDSEITKFLRHNFLPESILVTIENENQLKDLSETLFFSGKKYHSDKTTCYVCKDFTCSLPLESISEIEKLL